MEAFEEEAIALEMGHLRKEESAGFRSALLDGASWVAWRLEDLSPTDDPYRLIFELVDDRPISALVRRLNRS